MKKYIWPLGGAVLVTIAFFAPGTEGHLWDSLLFGGVASIVFLIAFSVYWLRKREIKKQRKSIIALFSCLIVFGIVAAAFDYQRSNFQKETLTDIRLVIERGIAKTAVQENLNEVLKAYYLNDGRNKYANIEQAFISRYDSLISEQGTVNFEQVADSNSTLTVYLSTLEPDTIVLIAESRAVRGWVSDFENFREGSGYLQARGILTPKGVRYEREN